MGSARSWLAGFMLTLAAHSVRAQPSVSAPAAGGGATQPAAPLSPSTNDDTPPSTDGDTPVLPATAEPPPASPIADERRRDAHVDRVLLLPTAETQPAGSTTLSSYDLVVLQMSTALAERTQLSVTVTPPIESVFPLDVSLKSQVARGRHYRFALLGSVSGILGLDDGPIWLGRVGFVGQGCLDARCRSSINLGSSAILAGAGSLFASGAGLVWRVTDVFAMVAEVDTLVPSGRNVADQHRVVGAAGARFSGARWGVDAALYRTLDGDTTVPLLVGTYRVLPD